jgi:hypothetical protein
MMGEVLELEEKDEVTWIRLSVWGRGEPQQKAERVSDIFFCPVLEKAASAGTASGRQCGGREGG